MGKYEINSFYIKKINIFIKNYYENRIYKLFKNKLSDFFLNKIQKQN